VAVGELAGVAVRATVGVSVGVAVDVGVAVCVAVGVGVGVAVDVGVAVGVAVLVGVEVGVKVSVSVGVFVGSALCRLKITGKYTKAVGVKSDRFATAQPSFDMEISPTNSRGIIHRLDRLMRPHRLIGV